MTEVISLKDIPRFDGNEFLIWKFRVVNIFKAKKLTDLRDGSRAVPNTASSQAEKDKYIKDEANAMLIISATMEDKQFRPVINCTTVKQMWDKILQIHEKNLLQIN